MFQTLAERVPKDADLPDRAWTLDVLGRVLDGTLYDVLTNSFYEESGPGGKYIPIMQRRPSVRYGLASIVVQDSVSLLFSEGHFPEVLCNHKPTAAAMKLLIKHTMLNATMLETAVAGSVGSAAIWFRVLDGRVFFSRVDTRYLTPAWSLKNPDDLASVTQRYKVKGQVLAAQGYAIVPDDMSKDFWFQRVWTTEAETWYLPQKTDVKTPMVLDADRTIRHELGFVPLVWIKNLPGGVAPDGACTFRLAIDTSIEIDYQLSQIGRGLRYSSEPTLLLKHGGSKDFERHAGDAIVVSPDGDGKYLEINGGASAAVTEYVSTIRELALETVRGNRASPEKFSGAQSGRALELMNQGLVWLADNLRISYGESGLLSLLRMVVLTSRKMPLTIGDETVSDLSMDGLSLRWPDWYMPTPHDRAEQAQALKTHTDAGHISRETATRIIAPSYGMEDLEAEKARLAAERAEVLAVAGEQVQAKEVLTP